MRVIILVLLSIAALALLVALREIALLLVFAVFFAYLLAPLIELAHAPIRIRRRQVRLPRAAAIMLLYVIVFGLVAIAACALVPRIGAQLSELAAAIPTYLAQQREHVRSLDSWYERSHLPPALRQAVETVAGRLLDGLAGRGGQLSADVLGTLRFVPWLVLVPVIAFFLLKDAESFRRSALLALPSGPVRWRGADFLSEVNT
ncbi:MAG: AI-2E family transporter, partial [Myxococcales bacterium]|nr:AI-2E family transporter [Myxococcales bacterium]